MLSPGYCVDWRVPYCAVQDPGRVIIVIWRIRRGHRADGSSPCGGMSAFLAWPSWRSTLLGSDPPPEEEATHQ